MVGILIQLSLSWLLLYVVEKKHLNALGFTPVGLRLLQFLKGFLFVGVLCALVQLLEVFLSKAIITANSEVTILVVLEAFWWDFKSVVFEELIFRGALLYILIHKIGEKKAILFSAIAFGIYHWFSFGIFGNIIPMIFIFLGTGLMGYALAKAFTRTGSIMVPIGLHLGWNFVYNSIFSKGPLGDVLLIMEGGSILNEWISLLHYLVANIGVPLAILAALPVLFKDELILKEDPIKLD